MKAIPPMTIYMSTRAWQSSCETPNMPQSATDSWHVKSTQLSTLWGISRRVVSEFKNREYTLDIYGTIP